MEKFDVWVEGYMAKGAKYLGNFVGDDFEDACYNMVVYKGWDVANYAHEDNSYWGCKFFDNEKEARQVFG